MAFVIHIIHLIILIHIKIRDITREENTEELKAERMSLKLQI